MKNKVTLNELKRMVKESAKQNALARNRLISEEADPDLRDFTDNFISNILENNQINEDSLNELVERNLSNDWEVYNLGSRRDLVSLNVKGYGGGDFEKFNKDGRAEGLETEYYHEIQFHIENFYNDWNNSFKDKFGLPLYVEGRSNGHWGVEVTDYKNFYDVFTINDNAIAELFQKMKADNEYEESAWDLGYDAALDLDYADVAKYIDFKPEFVAFLNEFEQSVKDTSAKWESQEWNDELFNNGGFAENEPDDEDLYNESTRVTLKRMKRLTKEAARRRGRRICESGEDYVSDFRRTSLGVSFKGKFGSMRKPDEFVIYPKYRQDKICIQGDGRWGEIDTQTGILLLSAKHGFANNITLTIDKVKGLAKTIELKPQILEQILDAVENKTVTDHRFDNVISVVDDD